MRRPLDLAAGLVLVVAGVLVLVELSGPTRVPVSDPLGPHGLPRVLAGGLIVFGVLLAAGAWRRPPPESPPPESPPPESPDAQPPPLTVAPQPGHSPERDSPVAAQLRAEGTKPAGRLVTAATIAATIGYVFALPRLGFVVSTALLGFVLLPVLGARRWYTVLGVPVAITAALWFGFGYLLDVGLPGFLGRY